MQSSSIINPTNNKNYLTPEHRSRLCQILNELTDNQLRFILIYHLQSTSIQHQFQQYTRTQLYQQCIILIDNYYTLELDKTICTMKSNHYTSDFYQQPQQQQQQQQQTNFSSAYNQQTYHFNQPNYRLPHSPAITQQLRTIRPTPTPTPHLHTPQQSPYTPSLLSSQQRPSSPGIQRYQVPLLPQPSSFSSTSAPFSYSSIILPSANNPPCPSINKVLYKTLPFYRPITCIHERYDIFQYDQYRKQYMSHDEFILSLDVCNELALSYDYDPNTNVHKTSKCLLLRLARIDQPPAFNGKYDDNLPPNITIHVNGHTLTNLPIPKPCARQQNDLIRTGREIDITSNCMFNPILKNEIKIVWSYRQDNTVLHVQYANAQYALHIFLVEHLTVDDLCELVKKKSTKFFRDDLVKLLAKARANDRDLGLEVSDQKLKLVCPIDQRRLKKPVRATTCQHLQCFDLINYIALNEKSNKWICPVCNKLALFEDLQIDAYTEAILNSIQNENITEISISSELLWTPVVPSKSVNDSIHYSSLNQNSTSSPADIIFIDDDD